MSVMPKRVQNWLDERRMTAIDLPIWVLGMIVHPDQRRRGIGRLLLAALGDWAADRGWQRLWVATGGPAVRFYEDCGWENVESFARANGEMTTVLMKLL